MKHCENVLLHVLCFMFYEFMISLPLPPKIIQKEENKAIFKIEELYPGYGVTIGNALRRVLLSSLRGTAVTDVKIKGVSHEFSAMPGVLEDVIVILLNLKNLRFKIHDENSHKLDLKVKGEREIKGADFNLSPQVTLVNPDLRIATITNKKTEVEMEITIEKGIGYEPKERRKTKKSEVGNIVLDAIYTPVRNVNYSIENMRVGDRTDFDRLILEIETDGTIGPKEAFYQSCEIIINHFNIIFKDETVKAEEKEKKESPKTKKAKTTKKKETKK